MQTRDTCPQELSTDVWLVKLCSSVFFVNLCCVLNALCQSGVNHFQSFNLGTLDALDYIRFMFYSARFTAHPDMIKGSFNICNVSFRLCFSAIQQMFGVKTSYVALSFNQKKYSFKFPVASDCVH